jgi:hypothetical protein
MRGVVVRAAAAVWVLAVVGCAGGGLKTATDIQLEHIQAMRDRSRAHQQDMIDNAVLADMSLAEFHFIPHSAELSGTGVKQLDRMAPMLDTYGGTVHYGGNMSDDELVKQRIAHVHEYLAMTGCNMDHVKIVPGLAGGTGMQARTALEKQHRMDAPADQNAAPQMLGVSSK